MTFTRTSSGIANQHIFNQANIVVYVEGEGTISPAGAIDIALWREFFSFYFPTLNFHFKSLGGKPHALAMADKIMASSIPNSLVAMDRDYDELFGAMIKDDRVFYTYGYGSENDLFHRTSFAGLARALLPGLGDHDTEAAVITRHIETTAKDGKIAAIADQVTNCRHVSIIDRKKPQSNLDLNAPGLPLKFRRERIRPVLEEAKQANIQKIIIKAVKFELRLIPCHVYYFIVYHTFLRWQLGYTQNKFSSNSFMAVAFGVIQNSIFDSFSDEIRTYYDQLGSRNISRYLSG